MKENQNATFYDSKSFRSVNDPLTFGSKEIYESDDSRTDVNPLAFEAKGRDERWNSKVIDDFSMDNENGTIDSPRKDNQNGLSYHLSSWEKDADTLSSDINDKEEKQISPAYESLVTVEEFTHCNGNESRDSSSQRNGASDLFETVTNSFTDKNVLECELPELEVMKDICVDNGRPEKDKNLIESFKDDKSGHCEAIEASSMENANRHTANQCGSKEENDGKLVSQERIKSSDSSSDKDTAKHCDPQESVQTGEANYTATGTAATNSSEVDSFVDKKLPIQEYGTRSFLRSFLNSLDGEENKLTQPPDQVRVTNCVLIPIGEAVSESPSASSAEAGLLKEDVQASSLLYNSKVESGTITFNFSDAGPVQCTSSSHDQSLVVKDKNSDGSSANSNVQCVSSKDSSDKNVHDHEQSSEPKDGKCSTNDDVPAVEPNVSKHEHRNSGDVSVVSQWKYDEGETSFSAASLVTYSGPIAYSGSLSHRSDGSTTSARSFAFPV
ncbi:hypothetical protein DH2020_032289 [Rehmannia glutinosa]|uniref:Uncharacterized protein n=1 Tax=Rehmannia glutinosa TaxID=99300 RepID=A0ABR0VHD3_REHGL